MDGVWKCEEEGQVQSQAVAHATPSHPTPELVAFNLWLPPFLGGTVAGKAISHLCLQPRLHDPLISKAAPGAGTVQQSPSHHDSLLLIGSYIPSPRIPTVANYPSGLAVELHQRRA